MELEPTSVPLLAGLRHMEESLFLNLSVYILNVYNDAQSPIDEVKDFGYKEEYQNKRSYTLVHIRLG